LGKLVWYQDTSRKDTLGGRDDHGNTKGTRKMAWWIKKGRKKIPRKMKKKKKKKKKRGGRLESEPEKPILDRVRADVGFLSANQAQEKSDIDA